MNKFLKVLNSVLILIMGYNLNVYAGCGAPSCGGMPSPNIPIPEAVTPLPVPLPEFPIGNNAADYKKSADGVKIITDGEIKGNAFNTLQDKKSADGVKIITDGEIKGNAFNTLQDKKSADGVKIITDGEIKGNAFNTLQDKKSADGVKIITDGEIKGNAFNTLQDKKSADGVKIITDGEIKGNAFNTLQDKKSADGVKIITDGEINQDKKSADGVKIITDGEINQDKKSADGVKIITDGEIKGNAFNTLQDKKEPSVIISTPEEELTAIQQELLEWKALRAQSLGIGGEINQDKKSGEIKSNATGVEINSGETTNEKKIEVLNSNDGEIANKKKTGAKVILMALLMALGWVASTHLGYEFKKVDKDDVDPESDDRIFAPTDANDDFLNKKIAELQGEGKIVIQGLEGQDSTRFCSPSDDPNASYCNQFLVFEKNEWVVKDNEE